MNILALLCSRFETALDGLTDNVADLLQMVRPSQDPKFGDYQANFAMPLGKQLSKPPRDVAQQIVDRLDVADFCEPPEIAGPGFINISVRRDWLAAETLRAWLDTERAGVAPVERPRVYVIDYSSPNVAKPMHVGHIRSTVIGDAIYKLLHFLGHKPISDNHIGDWGTQFGMILYGFKHFLDRGAYETNAVAELSRLYRLVTSLVEYEEGIERGLPELEREIARQRAALERQAATTDAEDKKAVKALRRAETRLAELQQEQATLQQKLTEAAPRLSELLTGHPQIGCRVLEETAKLHTGDDVNRRLWAEFLPPCMAEIEKTYQRLGVKFDYTLGESAYQEMLGAVVSDLKAKGLARESDGALCVFLEGYETPFIVQKQDGAFLYSTTDLATIDYRRKQFQPDAILYVVDHRQSLHFEQLFATARLWISADLELEHVRFGTVLGSDGRPYKTRSGDTVGLTGLLDEAVGRAHKIVSENDDAKSSGPELNQLQRQQVAEAVGIGALKYADLAQNRTSDYEFSYDKMLAMNGNTATYMQYATARVRSIFSRGGISADALRNLAAALALEHPAERRLALELLRFSEALSAAAADYRPNVLTAYLFGLANLFSNFYEQCPVLKADTDQQRIERLVLCDLTGRILAIGLGLLGITVVEKM